MTSLGNRLQLPGQHPMSRAAYELIERPKDDQKREASDLSQSSVDNKWPREHHEEWPEGTGLPPMSIIPRSKKQIYGRIGLVSFGSSALIAVLATTIWLIASSKKKDDEWYLNPWAGQSCDLQHHSSSAIENTFLVDLRGATHLTYTQAKVVDVSWQLLVGGGGRLLLACVSYVTFMDGLTRLLERDRLPYNLYASITFETTSLLTTAKVLRAVASTKGWHGKAFLGWFIVSSIWVLGFPNFIAAVGGYVTPSSFRFAMPDGNLLSPKSDDFLICYRITGGLLIGLDKNSTVVTGPSVRDYLGGRNSYPYSDSSTTNLTQKYPLFYAILGDRSSAEYIYETNSTQDKYGHYEAWHSNFTYDNHTYILRQTFISQMSEQAFCYKDQPFLREDIDRLVNCQPTQFFVWGVSSVLLQIVFGIQMAWIIGMLAVWVDANLNSTLCRHNRLVRGPFRAAIDLAEAIKEVVGGKTSGYSNSDMAKALSRQPGLRYYSDAPDADGTPHVGLSSIRVRWIEINSSQPSGEMRPGIARKRSSNSLYTTDREVND